MTGRFFGKQVKPGADPHIVYWIHLGALHVLLHGVYRQVHPPVGSNMTEAISKIETDAKRGMLMQLPDNYSALAHVSSCSLVIPNSVFSRLTNVGDVKSWEEALKGEPTVRVVSYSRRMIDTTELMWTSDTTDLNVLGTHEEWSVIPFKTFEAAEKEYRKLIRESETHFVIKRVPLDELDYRRSEVASRKLAWRMWQEWSLLPETDRNRHLRLAREAGIRAIGKSVKREQPAAPIVSGEDHLSDTELASLLRKARTT